MLVLSARIIKKEPRNAPAATFTISFASNTGYIMIAPKKENSKEKKAFIARLVTAMVNKSLIGSIRTLKNAVNIPTSNKFNIGVVYY